MKMCSDRRPNSRARIDPLLRPLVFATWRARPSPAAASFDKWLQVSPEAQERKVVARWQLTIVPGAAFCRSGDAAAGSALFCTTRVPMREPARPTRPEGFSDTHTQ